jgi:Flp pilus assembly protein CpaB
LSLACALIAASLAAYYYNKMAGMVTVAVAMQEIQADDMASPKNVGPGKTPRGALQSDTVINPSDLAGMAAKGYIPAGTVLRKSMFQPMSEAGVPAKLATMPGKVAIALPADINVTVGGVIKPGDRVTIKASEKGRTEILVSEATVLTVPQKGSKDDAITIAVTPRESQTIWDAKSLGKTIWHELLPGGSEKAAAQPQQQEVQPQQQEAQPQQPDTQPRQNAPVEPEPVEEGNSP